MQDTHDQAYNERRAREERQRVSAALNGTAASAHRRMAEEYERRAAGANG